MINKKESVEEVKESTINGCSRKLRHEVVNDRRISNMNDVVADIVTIAPYKQIHKEREKRKEQTTIKSYFIPSNTTH